MNGEGQARRPEGALSARQLCGAGTVAHHLWERTNDQDARHWTALYNGVTGAYFQSTLKHPIGLADYATLAWLGTSLATVAGAIGSSLEHEDTVRGVAYGYRQRRRQQEDGSSS
jgi:hypothetical protein